MMPPSIAARRRSATLITSLLSFTTVAGGWASPKASEPKYDDLEKRLAQFPLIGVPHHHAEGDANGAAHLEPSSYAKKFTGKHAHRTIECGIGHNLPQEALNAFAEPVLELDSYAT